MAVIESTFFEFPGLPLLYSRNTEQKITVFKTTSSLLQGQNIISKNAIESTNRSGLVQPPTTGQLWPKFAP